MHDSHVYCHPPPRSYYADDAAGGYEDYYAEEYDFFEECFFDAAGKPALADGSAGCDIRVKGVDKQVRRACAIACRQESGSRVSGQCQGPRLKRQQVRARAVHVYRRSLSFALGSLGGWCVRVFMCWHSGRLRHQG